MCHLPDSSINNPIQQHNSSSLYCDIPSSSQRLVRKANSHIKSFQFPNTVIPPLFSTCFKTQKINLGGEGYADFQIQQNQTHLKDYFCFGDIWSKGFHCFLWRSYIIPWQLHGGIECHKKRRKKSTNFILPFLANRLYCV